MHYVICGKKSVFGNQVAHDRMYINKRTAKKIKPNLQTMHLNLKGVRKKVKVCTGCMRTMRKHAGERSDIA